MKITTDLIQEFKGFYQAELYKELTVKRFEREIQKFFDFAESRGVVRVEEISIPLIEDYKTFYLKKEVPKTSRYYGEKTQLSSKTIEEKIQTIKNFLEFTRYKYEIGIDPKTIRMPKSESKRMDYFTYEEIQIIITAIDRAEKYEINRLRLKLIILIGFTTGLRLAEIMSLQVHQVMNGSRVIPTKGGKYREVFFSTSVRNTLAEYLKVRGEEIPRLGRKSKNKSDIDWVIISHGDVNFGCACVKSTICRPLKRLNEFIEIEQKKLSCHTLRHSCATHLLDNEVNIRYIQDILGHTHLTTTQLYLHTHNTKLKEIHNKVMEVLDI